jgi:hypothetical protein
MAVRQVGLWDPPPLIVWGRRERREEVTHRQWYHGALGHLPPPRTHAGRLGCRRDPFHGPRLSSRNFSTGATSKASTHEWWKPWLASEWDVCMRPTEARTSSGDGRRTTSGCWRAEGNKSGVCLCGPTCLFLCRHLSSLGRWANIFKHVYFFIICRKKQLTHLASLT